MKKVRWERVCVSVCVCACECVLTSARCNSLTFRNRLRLRQDSASIGPKQAQCGAGAQRAPVWPDGARCRRERCARPARDLLSSCLCSVRGVHLQRPGNASERLPLWRQQGARRRCHLPVRPWLSAPRTSQNHVCAAGQPLLLAAGPPDVHRYRAAESRRGPLAWQRSAGVS